MKVLSLTQPWATLIVLRQKRFETRGWPTYYRGPLGIHASMGFPRWCQELCDTEPFRTALGGLHASQLPRGAMLCITSIESCKSTGTLLNEITALEKAFGDYTPGRYGFGLGPIVTVFDPPRPAKGALGLWEWIREWSSLCSPQTSSGWDFRRGDQRV